MSKRRHVSSSGLPSSNKRGSSDFASPPTATTISWKPPTSTPFPTISSSSSPSLSTSSRTPVQSNLTPSRVGDTAGSVGSSTGNFSRRSRAAASGTSTTAASGSDFQLQMKTHARREFRLLQNDYRARIQDFYDRHYPLPPADTPENIQEIIRLNNVMADLAGDYNVKAREVMRRFDVDESGSVAMFGMNENGILGFSPTIDDDDMADLLHLPAFNKTLTRLHLRQLAVGGMHTVVLSTDGTPYSWGINDDGALGRTSTDDDAWRPKAVVDFCTNDQAIVETSQICEISAGASHSLFLTISGNVYSCGMYKEADSKHFKFPTSPGESVLGNNPRPVHLKMSQKVLHIFSGGNFAAAILHDRTMVTWGFGNNGELGRTADMTTPQDDGTYDIMPHTYKHEVQVGVDEDTKKPIMETRVKEEIVLERHLTPLPPRFNFGSPKKTVLNVACGDYHMLVVAREANSFYTNVYSTGQGGVGQLGHGNTESKHELTLIKRLEEERIGQVCAGELFSMALSWCGRYLFTWGRNGDGELGLGPGKDNCFNVPMLVQFPHPEPLIINHIRAGARTAFAITWNQECWSWGLAGMAGHQARDDQICWRPKKLPLDSLGNDVGVLDAGGSSQHSGIIAQKFAPKKSGTTEGMKE